MILRKGGVRRKVRLASEGEGCNAAGFAGWMVGDSYGRVSERCNGREVSF